MPNQASLCGTWITAASSICGLSPKAVLWAIVVLFIAGVRDAPAANDLTPMDAGRMALGYFSFLLLALIILPVPRALYEVIGVHGPYL